MISGNILIPSITNFNDVPSGKHYEKISVRKKLQLVKKIKTFPQLLMVFNSVIDPVIRIHFFSLFPKGGHTFTLKIKSL